MRRLCALLPLFLLIPQTAAADKTFTLSAGQTAFWDGPHVEEASGRTWTYRIRVTEPGYRLRIGIDHPEVGDVYEVDIVDPEGRSETISPSTGLYSAELLAVDPAVGTWRVTVRAENVTDSAFRMRAKLEARKPAPGIGASSVLPNLQVLPAHDASFLMPVTNGSTDGSPQGLDLAGTQSCHPEERVEDGAIRCLRFGFGVRNTGPGPLQLLLGDGAMFQDRDLIQRVQRANDTYYERAAGLARWHKTHLHYHHDAAIGLRLFSVVDARRGRLEAAGPMRTKGFAHREELLRDWERFYPTPERAGFGLSPGWADIYEWDRPGNYIDFGLNGDGRYIIRMWADPVDGILESNEGDNLGYTYLEVSGADIELIEVGLGRDPWDPCKIVMGFGGYPDPPRSPRPPGCSISPEEPHAGG